ncbi:MAG TPA: MGMT family protein, partial [Anaerolineales bacterium]
MDAPPNEFQAQVYLIVSMIPPGRLMTYGGIAALIPPPPEMDIQAYAAIRARWAGYALARCPGELPWHRVVNAQGRVSKRPGHGPHVQRARLEEEGLQFDDRERLDLANRVWEPEETWLQANGLLTQS